MDCLVRYYSIFPQLTNYFQVFKEGATFHGGLKTIALLEVEKIFRDELDPQEMFEGQRDREAVIERNVADLLERGKFLQNGKDNAVRDYSCKDKGQSKPKSIGPNE